MDASKKLKNAFSNSTINKDELQSIKDIEHAADKHVHKCLKIIEDAFITPINRSDIIEILKGIENITDSIDQIANHIYILNIARSNQYIHKFVSLVVESCERLHDLMISLKQYKKNTKIINQLIVEVNRLEEEGDATYSESMSHLFKTENNAINIIRNKELYQLLENSLDCCEDVADMVEKIMISST